jgi:hypothetical protein
MHGSVHTCLCSWVIGAKERYSGPVSELLNELYELQNIMVNKQGHCDHRDCDPRSHLGHFPPCIFYDNEHKKKCEDCDL